MTKLRSRTVDSRLRLIVVIMAVLILAVLFSGPALAQETWTASKQDSDNHPHDRSGLDQ